MRRRLTIAIGVVLLAGAPATATAQPPAGTPPTNPAFHGASFCSLGAFFAHEAIGILEEPGASDYAKLPPDSIENCTGPFAEPPPPRP